MSVAVQSFHAPAAAARTAEMSKPSTRNHRAPEVQEAEERSESTGRTGRHALMQALSNALGAVLPSVRTDSPAAGSAGDGIAAGSPPSAGDQKHALHEFIHELFGALRPAAGQDGAPGRHGRGFAWGRTTTGDLAQRLEALALSLPGTAPQSLPVEPPNSAPSSTDAAIAPRPPATPVAGSAGTDSPLLTAFGRLASAPGDASAGDGALSPADRLAALLHQLARALQPAASSDVPAAGSLIDLSA